MVVATIIVLLAIFVVLVWLNREAVLRYAAEQWIVSDDIQPADAVAILAGTIDIAPFAAADHYRKGVTRKIMIANLRLSQAEALGVLSSNAEINRGMLIKLGIPEASIDTFGAAVSTAHDEAQALRDWAMRTHARSIIVPTTAFSSRRIQWVLTRALVGTGTEIKIQALDPPTYNRAKWWETHQGVIEFQNEVIKYLYYRHSRSS
jgi:hypothetical protein